MHTLTDEEFSSTALGALEQVFANNQPFSQPFTSHITARRIIYPCFATFDEAIPVSALVTAATQLGDQGCYITTELRTPDKPYHCYIPLSELEEGYAGTDERNLISTRLGMHVYNYYTTIFSDSGRWGIRIFEEGMGFLGGTQPFLQSLQALVPHLDEQVLLSLKALKSLELAGLQLTIEWLPELLTHMYGEELTITMLDENGWI